MMRTIHLHGPLGEKYGREFRFDVATAGEAVQALCTNFPTMTQDIIDGAWHVVRGESPETGLDLDEDMIAGLKLGSGDLHIVPYLAGAKNQQGILKVVLGIALIGISFGFAGALAAPISAFTGAVTWGQALGVLGLALVLGGVSMLLAPEKKDEEEDEGSYVLSGASTSAREGTGIPLVYGRVITGGILISTGIDVDQIGTYRNMAVDPNVTNSLTDFYGSDRVQT